MTVTPYRTHLVVATLADHAAASMNGLFKVTESHVNEGLPVKVWGQALDRRARRWGRQSVELGEHWRWPARTELPPAVREVIDAADHADGTTSQVHHG